MDNQITVKIKNSTTSTITETIPAGTTLLTLSQAHAQITRHPILVATVDNELKDLSHSLQFDSTIEFLDITNPNGYRAYQRSVSFLMIYAAKVVLGRKARVVISHSINKNYFCELPDHPHPSEELLAQIEAQMRQAVSDDHKIQKRTLQNDAAIKLAGEFGLKDKQQLLNIATVQQ